MVTCVYMDGALHYSFHVTRIFCFALKVFVLETENFSTHNKKKENWRLAESLSSYDGLAQSPKLVGK